MLDSFIGRLTAIPYSLALIPAFHGITAPEDVSAATAAPVLCAITSRAEAPARAQAAEADPHPVLERRFAGVDTATSSADVEPVPQPSVLPTKPIRTIPPIPPPTIPTIPPPTIPTIQPPTLPTIKPSTRTPTVPPTRTASGSIDPRHLAFAEVASLPGGHSIWRLDYGLQYTGGMVGTTEDVEFQILNPGGDGSIDSAGAFTGCLDGRTGGFAFESEGTQNPDGSFEMSFVITPGTGHGGLSGVSGRFKVVATRAHCSPADTPETCTTLVSYTLAYSLPS